MPAPASLTNVSARVRPGAASLATPTATGEMFLSSNLEGGFQEAPSATKVTVPLAAGGGPAAGLMAGSAAAAAGSAGAAAAAASAGAAASGAAAAAASG